MESHYWQTEGQGHHLDLSGLKLLCFELLNLIEASPSNGGFCRL